MAALASVAFILVVSEGALPGKPVGGGGGTASSTSASTYVIGAAGDIVCPSDPYPDTNPDHCQYDDTADLVVGTGLTRVLPLGDDQYNTGSYSAFTTYYDPTWGRVLGKTSPVPGNHEYRQDPSSTPRGYFRYFGDRVKGPDGLGYYSFDLPPDCTPGQGVCWHLIAMPSMLCFADGGCGPASDLSNPGLGNRMYEWLKQDLEAHSDADYPCTLAFWHHPLFSFTSPSGAAAAVKPLWELLYDAHADVVLNGHSHNYQRWKPQDPEGTADPGRGIRQFVVGTGGASKYALQAGKKPLNLAAAQDDAFGILQITLLRARYSWEWVTARRQPAGFEDVKTKSIGCV
ncbi:MAG: metallophosphoesterase family protein [bacterium]